MNIGDKAIYVDWYSEEFTQIMEHTPKAISKIDEDGDFYLGNTICAPSEAISIPEAIEILEKYKIGIDERLKELKEYL